MGKQIVVLKRSAIQSLCKDWLLDIRANAETYGEPSHKRPYSRNNQNKKNSDSFQLQQRKFTKMVTFDLILIAIIAIIVFIVISFYFRSPYDTIFTKNHVLVTSTLTVLRANQQIIDEIGEPMTPGFIWGRALWESTRYDAYPANLRFKLKGPRGEVQVAISAKNDPTNGWSIYGLTVYGLSSTPRLDLR